MPLGHGEVQVGSVVLEVEPFEWPVSPWNGLELVASGTTGWRTLHTDAVAALKALYNGAHGRVYAGSTGMIVQYVEGTGGGPFLVADWRGYSGLCVFAPGEGFECQELFTEDSISYYAGRLRLILVG